MDAVHVEQLAYAYRRFPWSRPRVALAGVTLRVLPGTLHVLVGANGAGKSTLLRILAGMAAPVGGSARVLGHPAGHPAVRGKVAYLPEASDATSLLKAREAVELEASLYGLRGNERRTRARASLEAVGLGTLAERRWSALSKGERRRTALAQALVSDPELLLLDEPLDGVDPEWCERCIDLLQQRCRAGRSVLLSSHVLPEGGRGCDALTVLDQGRVVAGGSFGDVLARPGGGPPLSFAELLRSSRTSV